MWKVWRPKVTETERWYRKEILNRLKTYLQWWRSVNLSVDCYNNDIKDEKDYISKDTIYSWLKDKELKAMVDWWKVALEWYALTNIEEAIKTDKDINTSIWYLEKRNTDFKNKKEISIKTLEEDPEEAEEAINRLKKLWLG